MENLNNILSNNLIKLRKTHNLTQAELAIKLQYSDKTISKWETGEIIPSVENLIKICKLYNVSLDEITHPMQNLEKQLNPPKDDLRNKIIIALLSIVAVWAIATVLFVYSGIILKVHYWKVFIWAVPVSCIVALSFNRFWGNRAIGITTTSLLIWSLITSFYLEFLEYNLFAIYFIGIPVQISALLWSGLKKSK